MSRNETLHQVIIEKPVNQELTSALQRCTEALLTINEPQALFTLLTKEVMDLIGGAGGLLYIRDSSGEKLVIIAGVGIAEKAIGMRTSLEDSLSGWVTLNKKLLLSNRSDERINQKIAGAIGLTNIAAAPLFFENETVGALVITDKKVPAPFTEQDLGLLQIFAALASTALSKTRLYEKTLRYSRELGTIANVLSHGLSTVDAAPSLDDFLCNVAFEIGQKFDCRVDIGLAAGERLVVKVATQYGTPKPLEAIVNIEIPLTMGVMGRVATNRQPLVVNNVHTVPFYRPYAEETQSELAVPLATPEGKFIGVLNLESQKQVAFNQETLRTFTTIGNSLTLAIQNIQRLHHLHTLNKISEAFGHAENLDQILDHTVDTVATLLDAQACALYLREPGQDYLVLSRHKGLPAAVQNRVLKIEKGQTIAGRVLADGQSIIVRDMVNDVRSGGTVQAEDGLHSLVDVPIRTEDGVIGVLAILTADIRYFTEHEVKLLEIIGNTIGTAIEKAALQQRISFAEKRYRLLYETAGNPLFIMDLEGKILETNSEAESLTGYKTEELKGSAIFDIIIGKDAVEASRKRFEEARKGMKSEAKEFEIQGKHGSIFVESQMSPLIEADGQVFNVQIIWRDVSARKRHEEETQKHLQQLDAWLDISRTALQPLPRENLLEHIGTKARTHLTSDICSIHLFTSDQTELETYITSNAPFVPFGKGKMIQKGSGHIGWGATQSAAILKNDINLEPETSYLSYTRNSKRSHLLMMPLKSQQGKRLGVICVARLDGNNQNVYKAEDCVYLEGIANILTLALESIQLIDAQQSHRTAERILEQMHLVSAFLGHKLGGFLGAVSMTAKELQRQIQSTNPEIDGLLKNLISLSRTSTRIVGQLRNMENIINKPKNQVHLDSLITAAMNNADVPKRISIDVDLEWIDPPVVEANESTLAMIFEGLIRNAVDATPNSGTLAIRGSAPDRGNEVWFQFIDQGFGVAEHMQAQLFTPFFTTKKDSKGIGLGLWLSRWYVRYLGGDIEVKSTLGNGSVFTVRLPIKQEEFPTSLPFLKSGSNEEDYQQVRKSRGRFWSKKMVLEHKPKICIVEDDEAMRNVLCRMLISRDCDALWACESESALSLLEKDDFDGFFVDVRLEDNDPANTDGLKVVERILRKADHKPLFIMSVWDTSLTMAKEKFGDLEYVRILDKRDEEVEEAIEDLTTSFSYSLREGV